MDKQPWRDDKADLYMNTEYVAGPTQLRISTHYMLSILYTEQLKPASLSYWRL